MKKVMRERRRAYNSAVRQILSAAAAFALLVIAIVLVVFVLPTIIGGFIA